MKLEAMPRHKNTEVKHSPVHELQTKSRKIMKQAVEHYGHNTRNEVKSVLRND